MRIIYLSIFSFFTILQISFSAEVFVDPSIRPCDPDIAANWTYTPTPVYAPDTTKLSHRCEGKVKVFELTAEEVFSVFDPRYEAGPIYTWGYNGSNPGPVIEALEGETIKIILKNKLPEPTTIHWHGFELPFNMDGASGHSQAPVKPGESFEYSWTIHQSGTYMYHSGHALAKQLAMGLSGFFIVHSKKEPVIPVDRDILLFLQMWTLPPHSILPDTMDMMFNYFTINGKSAPLTTPIQALTGEKVRVRFANISMMQHPIHLHGHTWKVVATGAGDNPQSTFTTGNTILVPVGQTLDVVIDKIEEPGDWNFHCHLPHHVTNNMEIDPVPGEPMVMGDAGMYTLFKVRRPGEPDLPDYTGSGGNGGGGGHHMAMAPKIGIYEGEISLANGKTFATVFEVLKVQEDDEWRKLEANLKIVLNQSEYLLYHFDKIKYNWKTGELFFDSEKKGIVLNSLKFMMHGQMGMLMGDIRTEYAGVDGKISMHFMPKKRDFNTTVKDDSAENGISGEYAGKCEDKDSILLISAARGLNQDLVREGNPFYQFVMKGQIAKIRRDAFRVDSFIENGVYNPFTGKLSLKINKADVLFPTICNVEIDDEGNKSIDCDNDCSFSNSKAKAATSKNKDEYKFKDIDGKKVSQLTPIKTISGTFKGKLLHTSLGRAQDITLNIVSKYYAPKPMELPFPYVSATLNLYFSENNFISYKFAERKWLDSTSKSSQNKNSLKLMGDAKVYIITTKWQEDSIEGVVYHEDYGQVGPFQAVREGSDKKVLFVDDKTPPQLIGVNGKWKSNGYNLKLKSIEIDNEELEIGNPYFPLHLLGKIDDNVSGVTIPIVSGNYNFFTGEVSLLSSDERLIKGKLNDEGLSLYVPNNNARRARYKTINQRVMLERVK